MKRAFAASVVAFVLVLTPAAFAAGPKESGAPVEVGPLPISMNLSALFARAGEAPKVTNGAHGMQSVENPFPEVVIAKRNTDGTVSTACVDSEAAARRFFAATPKARAQQPQTSQEK
jgi:hypothetical protein